jgi:hypothetical protein
LEKKNEIFSPMIYILASGGKMKKGILAVLILSGHCLVSAQTITLVSPKGGETWGLGSPQIITWNYSGIPDGTPVKLVLFQNGNKIGNIIQNISIGQWVPVHTTGRPGIMRGGLQPRAADTKSASGT